MASDIRAHVDFAEIGNRPLGPTEEADGEFEGTGITLPTQADESWILHIEAYGPVEDIDVWTGVFEANRLNDIGTSIAGVRPDASGQIVILYINELSTNDAPDDWGIGHTRDDELLVVFPAFTRYTLTLFHLEPKDVGVAELTETLTGRILPAPTEDTRGLYLRQSPDGETFELVSRPPTGGASTVYASADEYRARSSGNAGLPDDLINEQLEAASRIIDQELRVGPGYFAPHDATYVFPTEGDSVLYLRDDAGLAFALRDVVADGVKPDYELSGTYDEYAWDFDDVWLWPTPRNGAAMGIPFTSLELRNIGSAPIVIWPTWGGSVEIEGSWGWAAIPAPIRELTVRVARDMRDRLRGGAAGRSDIMDDVASFRDDTWRLWNTVKTRYGRKHSMVW